jgi:general secretion pathway protein A
MYLRYYNLKKKPFENTPDPLFLFESKKHREVLASLVYGINSGKGLLLVVGDIGTGKTTLIHALLKRLDPSFITINFINPCLDPRTVTFEGILVLLARRLGLSHLVKDKIQLLEIVTRALEALDRKGRKVVLIFDEAHLLSEKSLEEIRLLSNIENERRKLIQIVIVGQNELNAKIEKESLRPLKQRVSISRRLERLNKSETEDYINHRVRVAGNDSQLFKKKAISLIFKESEGIPRLINQICDNSLLIGYAVESRSITRRIVKEVIDDMNSTYDHKEDRPKFPFFTLRWSRSYGIIFIIIILLLICLVVFKPLGKIEFQDDSNPASAERKDPVQGEQTLSFPIKRPDLTQPHGAKPIKLGKQKEKGKRRPSSAQ